MKIISPVKRDEFSGPKLEKRYLKFKKLIDELQSREIPEAVVGHINKNIEILNHVSSGDKNFSGKLRRTQGVIINTLLKEVKIVPKNYYRNMWLGLGMAVFGIPMGVAFGTSLDNMAFLGIGIPIGMAIGIAVGTSLDEQARREGRQLDIDLG